MAEERISSRYRSVPGKWWGVITVGLPLLAILLAVAFTFQAPYLRGSLTQNAYLWLIIALFLPLIYYWRPLNGSAPRNKLPWYDLLALVLSLAVPLYFVASETTMSREGWGTLAPPPALVAGAIMVLLLFEAARRTTGLAFAVILVAFALYPLFGSIMPGLLYSDSFSLPRVISYHVFSWEGITGTTMIVYGRLFIGYMVFALVIQAVGAEELFLNIAMTVLGRRRGGFAKVAIVSSGLFATMSGSTVANVFVCGSFTIPAMKREGFSPEYAGGVEATASAGGPLMPPVMGSVAFIMAQYLGVSYATVCLVAIVPSLLYFMVLFLQIDAHAARFNLAAPAAGEKLPPLWRTLLLHADIILGFAALCYMLFVMQLESWSPWVAAAVTLVFSMFKKKDRITLRRAVPLLEGVGKTLSDLLTVFAGVGVLISAMVLTGLAYSFPHILVTMSGGNLFLLLVLAAIASFILGTGLPVSAVYIFLAITVAPALVELKIDLMAAHFFMLYTAVWSSITPPVAIAAFAAAGLAGADPMKTAWQATRLGVAKYLLPFFFTISPGLILRGTIADSLQSIPTAIVGFVLICGALEGYMWRIGTIGWVMRGLFFAAGAFLAVPYTATDILGACMAAALFGGYFAKRAFGHGKVTA